MPETTGKRREKPEEDLALLEEITKADPAAGMQFLEYLVLQRRSTVWFYFVLSIFQLSMRPPFLLFSLDNCILGLLRCVLNNYARCRWKSRYLSSGGRKVRVSS